MPKYVIEREVPGAGKMSPDQLQAISQTSCGVLRKLGPEIQWVHSYVTGDKIYCIYNAPNEAAYSRTCHPGWIPSQFRRRSQSIIDPTTPSLNKPKP